MHDRPSNRTPAPALLARQEGAALVTVMFLAAVILTIVVMASRGTQTELRIAHNEYLAKQALNTAEAGINHAFSLLNTNAGTTFNDELANGGTGGAVAAIGTLTTLEDGLNYRFAAFGGGSSDGYYVRVVDTFDEQTGADNPAQDADGKIDLIARGRVGGAERVIQARVTGNPLFPYALFGINFVSQVGSSYIDSYDSRVGAYSFATHNTNGNVGSNGNISMTNNATIYGSATAGTTVSGGTITGATTQNAPLLSFPPVTPCGPPYSTSGVTGSYTPATGVVNGSIVLASNATYCFSSITQTGQETLTVSGPVSVYVTGDAKIAGGGIVNTTSLASNLLLFIGGTTVKITGSSNGYAAVYAPSADATITGTADFYGALIAASYTRTGSAGFHYDEALGTLLGPGVKLSNWHEIRNS